MYMTNTEVKKQILIVDDDLDYAERLRDYLSSNEYEVNIESDGLQAINRIRDNQPNLVLINVDMTGESGLTICKLSRKDYVGGIMLLSHRIDELDQVLGLDMGADDYVDRRSSLRLVLARSQAILRRLNHTSGRSMNHDDSERLEFDQLIIDNSMREAWLSRQLIELTSAEFDLLWLLASHAGEVLTREEIFNKLRGIEYDGQDRSVDVRVSRIRPKIGDDPFHPRRIKTVRSKGYLFVTELNT